MSDLMWVLNFFIEDFDEELTVINYHTTRNTAKRARLMQFVQKASRMKPKKPCVEQWMVSFYNYTFYKLFRMQKQSVEKLEQLLASVDSEKVLQRSYNGGHHPVNVKSQILIFLWFMATGDTLISMGTRFDLCPATMMNVTNKLLYFIGKLKQKTIRWPSNIEELEIVSNAFTNYPGVVGAIDGSHIFTKVPSNQQDSYTDRYRRQSINLMAICDAKSMFTYVFVGFPGSAHDSRVFQNSLFVTEINRFGPNKFFHDHEKYHLIGDSAFLLQTWLMTPYKDNGHLTRIQKTDNRCLSSARIAIEHAFGALKGRWRRLQFINTYSIFKTVEIALAGCVLHNFCQINNDVWDEEMYYEDDEFQIQENHDNPLQSRQKRDRIAAALNRRT